MDTSKQIRCRVILDIVQEISLTEVDLAMLESQLEDTGEIKTYIYTDDGLKINPIWDIIYSQIDLDFSDDPAIVDVELEDIES